MFERLGCKRGRKPIESVKTHLKVDGGPLCHELAFFLLFCRYVDDLGESKAEKELCQELATKARQLFGLIGLKCKGWMEGLFAMSWLSSSFSAGM